TRLMLSHTDLTVVHSDSKAGGRTSNRKYFNASRAGKITFSHAQPMKLPIAVNTGETTFCHSHTIVGARVSRTKLNSADRAGLIAFSHAHTTNAPIAANTGCT